MPFDFSQLGGLISQTGQTGAGSAVNSGGGFSGLSSVLGGLTGGGASGGGGNSFITGAISGASMGAALGPYGAAAGAALGGLSTLMGGGTAYGTTEFDALHNPNYPRIEASTLRMGEVRILAGYAEALGISVEEVMALLEFDSQTTGHSIRDVWDSWRNSYNPNIASARYWIGRYNQANPGRRIVEGSQRGFAASAGAGPGLNFTQGSMPGNLLGSGSPTIRDYATGVYQGAIRGGAEVFGTSREGQQLQNDGAKQWLEKNWYIPTGIFGVFGAAMAWALSRKRK
jgi:hypothetical protein